MLQYVFVASRPRDAGKGYGNSVMRARRESWRVLALLLPPRYVQASRESLLRKSLAGPPREEARIYLFGPIPAVPSISLVWFGVLRPPIGDAVRPPLSIPSSAHVAAFVDRLADWRSATTRGAMQSDRSCQGGRPLPPVRVMQIRPAPAEADVAQRSLIATRAGI